MCTKIRRKPRNNRREVILRTLDMITAMPSSADNSTTSSSQSLATTRSHARKRQSDASQLALNAPAYTSVKQQPHVRGYASDAR